MKKQSRLKSGNIILTPQIPSECDEFLAGFEGNELLSVFTGNRAKAVEEYEAKSRVYFLYTVWSISLFDKDDRSILDEVVAGIKDDRFNFMVSGPYCMEIVPKGVSKAVACDKFAEILNINNDEILSFGDSDNDMGMLLNSCGVILGHAPERLKCQLQYITDGVEADGVYTFLKKEGFIA